MENRDAEGSGGHRSQLVGDIIAFAIQVTAEAN
jgi:hypothetical protein